MNQPARHRSHHTDTPLPRPAKPQPRPARPFGDDYICRCICPAYRVYARRSLKPQPKTTPMQTARLRGLQIANAQEADD